MKLELLPENKLIHSIQHQREVESVGKTMYRNGLITADNSSDNDDDYDGDNDDDDPP